MPKYLVQAISEDDFGEKNYVVELELILQFPNDAKLLKRYRLPDTTSGEKFPVWTILVGRKKFYILEVLGKNRKTITEDKIRNGNDFKNAEICYIQPARAPAEFNQSKHARYYTKRIDTVTVMQD